MKHYRLRYQIIDSGEEHDIIMGSEDIEFYEVDDISAIRKTNEYLFKNYRTTNILLEEITSRKVTW